MKMTDQQYWEYLLDKMDDVYRVLVKAPERTDDSHESEMMEAAIIRAIEILEDTR